jgi:hypothetical protein
MTSAAHSVVSLVTIAASAAIPIIARASAAAPAVLLAPPWPWRATPSPLPPLLALPAPPAPPPPTSPDLSRLFLEHRQALVGLVQRYTGSREDAEDAVQNAFMEALRGDDDSHVGRNGAGDSAIAVACAGGASPSAWLFGLALSLARRDLAERRVPG